MKTTRIAAGLAMLVAYLGCSSASGGGSGSSGGPSGDGGAGTRGDDAAGGEGGAVSSSGEFVGSHWSTPNCPNNVCYDVELSSDGTYRKQMIVMSGSSTTLFCEHGSWKMLDSATLEFVPCKGDPYQQSWSYSPGVFVLQRVTYQPDPGGIFNCGPNDC